MRTLMIELGKEKRTGVIPVLLAAGILGAAYAFVNFLVRRKTLLNLCLLYTSLLADIISCQQFDVWHSG